MSLRDQPAYPFNNQKSSSRKKKETLASSTSSHASYSKAPKTNIRSKENSVTIVPRKFSANSHPKTSKQVPKNFKINAQPLVQCTTSRKRSRTEAYLDMALTTTARKKYLVRRSADCAGLLASLKSA